MRFETDVLTLEKDCWLSSCDRGPTCKHRFYRKAPTVNVNIACFQHIDYKYDISNAKKIVLVFDTNNVRGSFKTAVFRLSFAGRVAIRKHFSQCCCLNIVCNEDKSLILRPNDLLSWWVEIVEEF